MASRQSSVPALQIDTVSAREGKDTLRELRAGRGGRSSVYQPILEQVQALPPGEVVRVDGVARAEVNALRAYVYRYVSRDIYRVKSTQEGAGDRFTVAIGRWADLRG